MSDMPFRQLKQIGFVVEDVDALVERWKSFGFESWTPVIVVNGSTTEDMRQADEPIDYETKVAINFDLGVELEFIEPVSDNSIYAVFLREHGPGLHHLQIDGEDGEHGKMVDFLMGLTDGKQLISGGPAEFRYRYFDTVADLGFIAETLGDIDD